MEINTQKIKQVYPLLNKQMEVKIEILEEENKILRKGGK